MSTSVAALEQGESAGQAKSQKDVDLAALVMRNAARNSAAATANVKLLPCPESTIVRAAQMDGRLVDAKKKRKDKRAAGAIAGAIADATAPNPVESTDVSAPKLQQDESLDLSTGEIQTSRQMVEAPAAESTESGESLAAESLVVESGVESGSELEVDESFGGDWDNLVAEGLSESFEHGVDANNNIEVISHENPEAGQTASDSTTGA